MYTIQYNILQAIVNLILCVVTKVEYFPKRLLLQPNPPRTFYIVFYLMRLHIPDKNVNEAWV